MLKHLAESDEKGLIWLTGSQQYNMMKRVHETLTGRIAILELYSLTAREKAGLVFDTDLDFSLAALQTRPRKLPKINSYIDTYLMHDATEAGGITDTVRFRKFLVGCASLKRGNGGIICMCEEPIPIDADNCFIPSNLI